MIGNQMKRISVRLVGKRVAKTQKLICLSKQIRNFSIDKTQKKIDSIPKFSFKIKKTKTKWETKQKQKNRKQKKDIHNKLAKVLKWQR